MEKYDLLKWKEFGKEDAPSIRILFSDSEYPNQEKIAKYLDTGKTTLVAASVARDCFTGEEIHPQTSKCIKSNDVFSWDGSLSYYIRRYNLRLPAEFEEMILSHAD